MKLLLILAMLASTATAADYQRTLTVGGKPRSYRLHVPRQANTALVLAFHGTGMNGSTMAWYSGLSTKSESAGFVVAYPNGIGGKFNDATDVAFAHGIISDVQNVVTTERTFATGISNGAIFCYKLAAESRQIAAIAPVAGTMLTKPNSATLPVGVIHFHGTEDRYVPYRTALTSVQTWARFNGCTGPTNSVSGSITKSVYSGQPEVVFYGISGGGHTWPGQRTSPRYLGATTFEINANDLMWEFFQRVK